MKLGIVGVGSAGSRIVNRILAVEKATGRNLCNGNTLLINSTRPEFHTTEHVPEDRRLTIGDVRWEADNERLDGDPDLAAGIAQEERNEIIRAFDLIEFHQVDGILVVAGLAGGTGGGAGAVVIDQITDICDAPVYAVGVLPAESEGQGPALTAARSLRSFVETADNVIVFDNDSWHPTDLSPVRESAETTGEDGTTEDDTDTAEADVDVAGHDQAGAGPDDVIDEVEFASDDVVDDLDPNEEGYARVNGALAKRLVTLFATGEFRGKAAPENRLDPSDIVRTLDTGGISTIGYASTDVPRTSGIHYWVRRVRDRLPWTEDRQPDDDESTDAAKINRLVRTAARSKLTLPCQVSSADRALITLSGPSTVLSRKGFESGRYWLEHEADIVDVMAGDDPHDRSTELSAVVLFSNVTDVSRIEAMQETALDAGERTAADETPSDAPNPQ